MGFKKNEARGFFLTTSFLLILATVVSQTVIMGRKLLLIALLITDANANLHPCSDPCQLSGWNFLLSGSVWQRCSKPMVITALCAGGKEDLMGTCFSRQQDMGKLIESREEMCILWGKVSQR